MFDDLIDKKIRFMNPIKSMFYIILLVLIGCNDQDDDSILRGDNCSQQVIISSELYENASEDALTIIDSEIIGDCLQINFGASGCDGKSWELQLIDKGEVLELVPLQRNVRLSLKNEELCQAQFTQEVSFDISSLQLPGNKLLINLEGVDEHLVYDY